MLKFVELKNSFKSQFHRSRFASLKARAMQLTVAWNTSEKCSRSNHILTSRCNRYFLFPEQKLVTFNFHLLSNLILLSSYC